MPAKSKASEVTVAPFNRAAVKKITSADEFQLLEPVLFGDPAALTPARRRQLLLQARKMRSKFRDQKQRQGAAARGKQATSHRKAVDPAVMAQKRDLFGAAVAVLEAEAPIAGAAKPAKKKAKQAKKTAAAKSPAKKTAKQAAKKKAAKTKAAKTKQSVEQVAPKPKVASHGKARSAAGKQSKPPIKVTLPAAGRGPSRRVHTHQRAATKRRQASRDKR